MKLLTIASVLTFFALGGPAKAVTEPKQKKPLTHTLTHQTIPRETLKAGQDIELRKVQAMLSGQKPKKVVKADPRR